MWPFKPNPEKIIKKMKKTEEKIQQLMLEGNKIALKPYSDKNTKRLTDIDDEIRNLKEEMIKMGKLVLKDGKLVDRKSVV